ncbi:hypothetical protein ABVK25_002396 [Lepraria finkii]|uniref:Uncharacterized protein n=1 Tax=Lepraria finkii TaxID=1340010 RepID=A0ABR4BHQ0_9LECA
MDEMFNLSNGSLLDQEIARVWKKIDPESLLRLLLVELYICDADAEQMLASAKQAGIAYDSEFLLEVVSGLYERVKDSDDAATNFWQRRCRYHVHGPIYPVCENEK